MAGRKQPSIPEHALVKPWQCPPMQPLARTEAYGVIKIAAHVHIIVHGTQAIRVQRQMQLPDILSLCPEDARA